MERQILQVLCKYFDINTSFIISDYLPQSVYCLFIIARHNEKNVEMQLYSTRQKAVDYVFEFLHGLYLKEMPKNAVSKIIKEKKQTYLKRQLLYKTDEDEPVYYDSEVERLYSGLFVHKCAHLITEDDITTRRLLFCLYTLDTDDCDGINIF